MSAGGSTCPVDKMLIQDQLTFEPKELLMGSSLKDTSAVHDDDQVGGLNGEEAVGNGDARPPLPRPLDRLHYQLLALRVQS